MNLPLKLPLDTTGIAKSNLVEDEIHILEDGSVRAISPNHGVFFSYSVSLYDIENEQHLREKIDYIFTEHYHSLSLFYQRDVAGIILVINPKVSNKIKIKYQAIGSHFSDKDKVLESFLNHKQSNKKNYSLLWDIYKNVNKFVPSNAHLDIGDQVGFEFITYGLEKLRNAITLSDFNAIATIVTDINKYLKTLTELLEATVKTEYIPIANEFIKKFTKIELGLGLVENKSIASLDETRSVAYEDYVSNLSIDKYVSLKGITTFKEELYNRLVTKKDTYLGVHYGVLSIPSITTLETLTNGATIVIDAYENFSINNKSPFDSVVYPEIGDGKDRWSITKIINNTDNRGGLLLGINLNTSETYIGILRTIEESIDRTIIWKKQITEYDIEMIIDRLSKHIGDTNNPHKTTKSMVGLGSVENLPPVTREDITCRKPSRKYVTFDALLLFMKAYMSCIKTVEDMKDEKCGESDVIRNIKLIFAPCGPCGPCCIPNRVTESTEPTISLPSVDPYRTLHGWFCEGKKKVGIYADGKGGTFLETLEEVSSDCGNYSGDDTKPLIPNIPTPPDNPTPPTTPSNPTTPSTPTVPNVPSIPNTPNPPTNNTPSTPSSPNIPSTPNVPNIPSTPTIPPPKIPGPVSPPPKDPLPKPEFLPKGHILRTFCRGYQRWNEVADGNGGKEEKIVEDLSPRCGYKVPQVPTPPTRPTPSVPSTPRPPSSPNTPNNPTPPYTPPTRPSTPSSGKFIEVTSMSRKGNRSEFTISYNDFNSGTYNFVIEGRYLNNIKAVFLTSSFTVPSGRTSGSFKLTSLIDGNMVFDNIWNNHKAVVGKEFVKKTSVVLDFYIRLDNYTSNRGYQHTVYGKVSDSGGVGAGEEIPEPSPNNASYSFTKERIEKDNTSVKNYCTMVIRNLKAGRYYETVGFVKDGHTEFIGDTGGTSFVHNKDNEVLEKSYSSIYSKINNIFNDAYRKRLINKTDTTINVRTAFRLKGMSTPITGSQVITLTGKVTI